MGEEKITRTITKTYVNVGTKENPEWELVDKICEVSILTRWDKIKLFFKKLLRLDK
jgi:hypothetical protein